MYLKYLIVPLAVGTFLSSSSSAQLLFNNPILDRNSADPSISRVGNDYYLTLSENGETELTIYKSSIMTSFRSASSKVAFRTPPGYSDLWASEMHEVDGELYIYFTMRTVEEEWRMYAIKAVDPRDPMNEWDPPVPLLPHWNYVAIDGTVMKHGDQKYFVWSSGRFGHGSIYISRMVSATQVEGPVVMIKEPTEEWECQDICTSEGPYFIYNRNVSYMIFSASMTWNPNYCLTQMSIPFDKDPMEPRNWDHVGGPVFQRNDEESVYTTGHAAFVNSPDGTETWMVYHATVSPTEINGFRTARLEKIDWNEDGSPRFPSAHGYNHPQPVPSGQTWVGP